MEEVLNRLFPELGRSLIGYRVSVCQVGKDQGQGLSRICRFLKICLQSR